MSDYERRPDPAAYLIRFLLGFLLGAACGAAPFAFFADAPVSVILTVAATVGASVGAMTAFRPRLWRWIRSTWLFNEWLLWRDWRRPPPDL